MGGCLHELPCPYERQPRGARLGNQLSSRTQPDDSIDHPPTTAWTPIPQALPHMPPCLLLHPVPVLREDPEC